MFINPVERALDIGGAPKENPLKLHLGTQKAFTASNPGKPLMVSNTEAPGGSCVFCLVTLQRHSPKCPSILFKKIKHCPTRKVIMIFLMMVNTQLPWLNKNDQCINFSFPFKHREGYYRDVQITHLFTQLLPKRWTEEKVEQNSSICLQNSSPSLYNYILFILIQLPSSVLEISHQVNPNLVTWGILKHRNKTP